MSFLDLGRVVTPADHVAFNKITVPWVRKIWPPPAVSRDERDRQADCTIPFRVIRKENVMEKAQLWSFAIILDPLEEDAKKGAKSELLVAPQPWFLATQAEAEMRAYRAIPEEHLANAARIRVALKPF